jgi:hypothetical protein
MPKYLISFENGAMNHFTEEDWPEVGKAAHAVVQEAKDAGVFVFGGGLDYGTTMWSTPWWPPTGWSPTARTRSKELIGGFMIVDVPTRKAALEWAAKNAVACRCAQDVRKFMYDPEIE